MTALHDDEIDITEHDVRRLVDEQTPWRGRPLRAAGAGTDNRMFRLGDDLVVRLPRRPGTADDVAKEQRWLPRLAPVLPVPVPEPVFRGRPDAGYPFEWSVLRWIQGSELDGSNITDWTRFGCELGGFVEALHAADTTGARREEGLDWYRGERLNQRRDDGFEAIDELRELDRSESIGLDLDRVQQFWEEVTTIDDPVRPDVWLHADLRSANLVARDGRLVGVIDFGGLCLGNPTAEHAAIWEYPAPARTAYRERLDLDDDTWQRARGWAAYLAMLGVPYYWRTWPEFARGGLAKLRTVLETAD